MKAALAATSAVLAAFLFCAFASAYFSWHAPVTGPATAVCAIGLIACGLWLNRTASAPDDDDDDSGGTP